MNNRHIGKHIQKLREDADISQDEMAERIGKSKSLVSFVESKGKVSDKTLKLMADVLKVPFETLKVYPYLDVESQNQNIQSYKSRVKELELEVDLLKKLVDNQEKVIRLLESQKSHR